LDLLFCLGEEAPSKRIVGVEGDFEAAESGEEGVPFAGSGGVITLVHGQKDVAVLVAVVVDGLYVFYSVIRETEAGEVALLGGLVNAG
jgi:hypothetical protein